MKQRKTTGEFMKRSRLYRLQSNERFRNERTYRRNSLLAAAILGFFFAIFISSFYKLSKITSPDALKQEINNKVAVNATTDKYIERGYSRCFDAIICIRDIGEELGFSNKDILIAIRIAKAESGYRTDAINLNSNKTADIGIFQINDVHSKRISRSDRMDMEKNIKFAYQLRKEQGNWNAWSVCRSKVNCK